MAKYIAIILALIFFVFSAASVIPENETEDPSLDIIKLEDAEEGYNFQHVQETLLCNDPKSPNNMVTTVSGDPPHMGSTVKVTCDPGEHFIGRSANRTTVTVQCQPLPHPCMCMAAWQTRDDYQLMYDLNCTAAVEDSIDQDEKSEPTKDDIPIYPLQEKEPESASENEETIDEEKDEAKQTDIEEETINNDDSAVVSHGIEESNEQTKADIAETDNTENDSNNEVIEEYEPLYPPENFNVIGDKEIDTYGPEEDLDGTFHEIYIKPVETLETNFDSKNEIFLPLDTEEKEELTNIIDNYEKMESEETLTETEDIGENEVVEDNAVSKQETHQVEADEQTTLRDEEPGQEITEVEDEGEEKGKEEEFSNENVEAVTSDEGELAESGNEVQFQTEEEEEEMDNENEVEDETQTEEEIESEDEAVSSDEGELAESGNDVQSQTEEEEEEVDNENEVEDETQIEEETEPEDEDTESSEYGHTEELEDIQEPDLENETENNDSELEHYLETEEEEKYEGPNENTNEEVRPDKNEFEEEHDILLNEVYPLMPPSIKDPSIVYAEINEQNVFDKENDEEDAEEAIDDSSMFVEVEPPGYLEDIQTVPVQASKEEIQLSENQCSLQPETGPCRAYFRRFFFNSKTQECDMFVYGGCSGNGNNFETLTACANACRRKDVNL